MKIRKMLISIAALAFIASSCCSHADNSRAIYQGNINSNASCH